MELKNVRCFLPSLALISVLTAALSSVAILSSCAVLHHVQVGQIDNRSGQVAVPFEILMSESGVNVHEIGALARAARSNAGDAAAGAAAIVSLFQFGPRTGNPVYNSHYAERLVYVIHEKCPSGRVTGLMSIREMRKYPVVSGEIVKLTGYCLKDRVPASSDKNIVTSEEEL
jgi:hypothetical protein